MMEPIQLIMIMLFVTFSITIAAIIFVIAGKDIFFAIKRFIIRKGSDVYIANSNRNITHYYRVPKDNRFTVNGKTYITNPFKTMNLSEIDKLKIVESLKRTQKRCRERIAYHKSVISLKQKIAEDTDNKLTEKAKLSLNAEIEYHKNMVAQYEKKLTDRNKNYFKDKRSAFFYIENDPVPKDFYEFYSEIDCKILDNIIKGVASQPATPIELKEDPAFKNIKMMVIASAVLSLIACLMGYFIINFVKDICTTVGATCAL